MQDFFEIMMAARLFSCGIRKEDKERVRKELRTTSEARVERTCELLAKYEGGRLDKHE